MARQRGLYAYDERYRRVFAAGALYWNDPAPNHRLAAIVDTLPVPSRCIEFGCGEGYQARMMASRGHVVTAVDLSPTAIAKAIAGSPPHLDVRYLVGDVTDSASLDLPPSSFDLAVDIGCLHMMADQEDRAAYLSLVRRALASSGRLFLQDGLDLDDVVSRTDDEARAILVIRQLQARPPDSILTRTIQTAAGERDVNLPLCPKGRSLSLEGYKGELRSAGFRVLSADRTGGANTPYEAVILAEPV